MPKVEQIICDGCRAVKRESNRWWQVLLYEDHLALMPLGVPGPWSGKPLSTCYFCGRGCVAEAVGKYLEQSEG